MINPLSPKEVRKFQKIIINPKIIEIFNQELIENYSKGCETIIYQQNIVDKIVKSLNISEEDVFNLGYLNIESYYEDNGWIVTYEKPQYDKYYFLFKEKELNE